MCPGSYLISPLILAQACSSNITGKMDAKEEGAVVPEHSNLHYWGPMSPKGSFEVGQNLLKDICNGRATKHLFSYFQIFLPLLSVFVLILQSDFSRTYTFFYFCLILCLHVQILVCTTIFCLYFCLDVFAHTHVYAPYWPLFPRPFRHRL